MLNLLKPPLPSPLPLLPPPRPQTSPSPSCPDLFLEIARPDLSKSPSPQDLPPAFQISPDLPQPAKISPPHLLPTDKLAIYKAFLTGQSQAWGLGTQTYPSTPLPLHALPPSTPPPRSPPAPSRPLYPRPPFHKKKTFRSKRFVQKGYWDPNPIQFL